MEEERVTEKITLTWKRSEEVTQPTHSTELYGSLKVIGLKRSVSGALLKRTAREQNER